MLPLQRHIFLIRKDLLIAVSLVRRSEHERLHHRRTPASLQKIPRPAYVALKSRKWIAVGDTHDRLRSEMKDDFDLVLAQHTFQQIWTAQTAAYYIDTVGQSIAHKFAGGNPIAYQSRHRRALLQQAL